VPDRVVTRKRRSKESFLITGERMESIIRQYLDHNLDADES
jgi:hypothetical protein